jgi:hypothetical protein
MRRPYERPVSPTDVGAIDAGCAIGAVFHALGRRQPICPPWVMTGTPLTKQMFSASTPEADSTVDVRLGRVWPVAVIVLRRQ